LPELAQNVNWGRWADKGFVAEIGGGSTQPYAVYNQTVGAQSFSSGPDADLMVVTVTY
jgi:spore coat protein U-like protein